MMMKTINVRSNFLKRCGMGGTKFYPSYTTLLYTIYIYIYVIILCTDINTCTGLYCTVLYVIILHCTVHCNCLTEDTIIRPRNGKLKMSKENHKTLKKPAKFKKNRYVIILHADVLSWENRLRRHRSRRACAARACAARTLLAHPRKTDS